MQRAARARARASPASSRPRSASRSTRCRAPTSCAATRASISPRRWSRRAKSAATSTISSGSTSDRLFFLHRRRRRARDCRRASSWRSARRCTRARCCATADADIGALHARSERRGIARQPGDAVRHRVRRRARSRHRRARVLQRGPRKSVSAVAGRRRCARLDATATVRRCASSTISPIAARIDACAPGELLCIVTDGVTEAAERGRRAVRRERVERTARGDPQRATARAARRRCAARATSKRSSRGADAGGRQDGARRCSGAGRGWN